MVKGQRCKTLFREKASLFSITTTLAPSKDKSMAVRRPQGPAPMMRHWKIQVLSGQRPRLSKHTSGNYHSRAILHDWDTWSLPRTAKPLQRLEGRVHDSRVHRRLKPNHVYLKQPRGPTDRKDLSGPSSQQTVWKSHLIFHQNRTLKKFLCHRQVAV